MSGSTQEKIYQNIAWGKDKERQRKGSITFGSVK